jgi:hypothetical protein
MVLLRPSFAATSGRDATEHADTKKNNFFGTIAARGGAAAQHESGVRSVDWSPCMVYYVYYVY